MSNSSSNFINTSTTDALLITQAALNPLIGASENLWVLILELQDALNVSSMPQLQKTLIKQIHHFETQAATVGYPVSTIQIASYFFCTWIDEIILIAPWSNPQEWKSLSLLQTLHHETWHENRFFELLDQMRENPKHTIDLLELAYLCLSLGYQGQFHNEGRISPRLNHYIDDIYDLIREQRGEISKQLYIGSNQPKRFKKYYWYLPPLWISGLIAILGFMAIYIPYHRELKNIIQPIQNTLHSMKVEDENK